MKNTDRLLFLIALSGISTISWAADNYFLCNTSKGILSLRGEDEKLIYEMDSQDGNKFQYVSKAPLYSGFLYSHYLRFQTNYVSVRFIQNSYEYTVFSNYDNGTNVRGVSVIDMKLKKEYVYNCIDYKIDKLSDLEKKLQCDINNALGCP